MRTGPKPRGLAARFWPKVDKRGPNECWPWMGGRRPSGYGNILADSGGMMQATHAALLVIDGVDVPSGMEVCHHCDNPPCVNPAHLFIGTRKDNLQDASAKGRTCHPDNNGENNGRALLSLLDVTRIRERYTVDHALQRDLATEYGVSKSTIAAITQGRNWKSVPA